MDALVVLPALVVALLWALSPALQKHVLKDISIETLIVIGTPFSIAALFVYWYLHHAKVVHDVTHNLTFLHIIIVAFVTLVCGFAANIMFTRLLQENDSNLITALGHSSPLFAVLIAFLFLEEEHVTGWSFLGAGLIVGGVSVLALQG